MKHVAVIDSDTGGFLLCDDKSMPSDKRVSDALNVLFDPDGRTCAVENYAGQDWAAVLQHARTYAAELTSHRLCLVIAAEGYLYISVQDEPLTTGERERVVSTGRVSLTVDSGSLLLTDGRFLFDHNGEEDLEEERVIVAPGRYDVTVYGLSPDPDVAPTVGVFGDDDSPAVIVHLAKVDAVEERPIDVQVDVSEWIRKPVTGAICSVTIRKVSGEEATADIHLTSHVKAGQARFTIPEGSHVGVGDECWVLLERDAGKYWTASLIEE